MSKQNLIFSNCVENTDGNKKLVQVFRIPETKYCLYSETVTGPMDSGGHGTTTESAFAFISNLGYEIDQLRDALKGRGVSLTLQPHTL